MWSWIVLLNAHVFSALNIKGALHLFYISESKQNLQWFWESFGESKKIHKLWEQILLNEKLWWLLWWLEDRKYWKQDFKLKHYMKAGVGKHSMLIFLYIVIQVVREETRLLPLLLALFSSFWRSSMQWKTCKSYVCFDHSSWIRMIEDGDWRWWMSGYKVNFDSVEEIWVQLKLNYF